MTATPNRTNSPVKPLKWYKKLATEKGRLEAGVFIVEGDRAVRDMIVGHPDRVTEIVTIGELPPELRNYPARYLSESQLRSISSTKTPQGIMAVVTLPVETYSTSLPRNVGSKVLLLEDVQDPGNVGTLTRTAAAFDYSGAILTEKCADPLSPKCVQSAAGTVLSLWLRRTARYLELVASLKQLGYCLVAADIDGEEDASALSRPDKLILALGNEAAGLSTKILDVADYRFKIPIAREKAESLNVAACGAICMYLSRQRA